MGSVIRCVFAVLLIIFSAACDGGDGTAPMPLTVTITQSPTGPQEEGTTVVFNVTVTGGTGPYTTTNWSFPSGSTTSVTAGVLSATVVLGDPGTYSASVDVLDAGVPAGTYPFAFQVIPAIPVVTAVTPDEGLPLQQVTFFYQAEGVVTAQEWGFGEGATPQTSSDASPVVTFSEPGLYTGTLRVENANGAGDPFEFSYLVNIPEPPTWQVTEFREVRRSYLLDGLFSMTLAGGRPAIAYNSPEGIRLLRATVEVPEGPQHWTDTLVVDGGTLQGVNVFAEREGLLYLLYYKGSLENQLEGIWIAKSDGLDPTSAASWESYQLAPAVQLFPSIALFPDEAGLFAGIGGTVFFTADPAGATSTEDWSHHAYGESLIVYSVSQLLRSGGELYLLYTANLGDGYSELKLAHALVPVPEGPADWERKHINFGSFREFRGDSMAVVAGKFVVTSHGNSGGGSLHVAGTPTPVVASELLLVPMFNRGAGRFGASSAVAAGRAAIPYTRVENFQVLGLGLARMVGTDPAMGLANGGWHDALLTDEEPTGPIAAGTLANDRLILVYMDSPSSRLRVSIAQGPF